MKTTILCALAVLLMALTAGALPSRPMEAMKPVGIKLYAGKNAGARRNKRNRRG